MVRAGSFHGLLVAILRFLWANKWWWIVPILLVILVFVALVMKAEPAGPFAYSAPNVKALGEES